MVKDVINPSMRLGCEVALDDLVEHLSALVQQAGQHIPVKGVLHLMEADHSHGQLVDFLLEFLHQRQLVLVELVIPVKNGQFDDGLDEVLDDLLCLLLVLGVFLGHPVELIQHLAARVIDEGGGDGFGHHFPQDLLLCLHGQVFGIEDICGHYQTLFNVEMHLFSFSWSTAICFLPFWPFIPLNYFDGLISKIKIVVLFLVLLTFTRTI